MENSNCPNCSLEKPPGSLDCPECGIVFDKRKKLHNEKDRAALAAGEASVEVQGARILNLALAAAAAAGWYWFLGHASASELSLDAKKFAKHAFALTPAQGWEFSTKEQCGGPLGACVVAEALKKLEGSQVNAVFQVVAIPVHGLQITLSNRAALAKQYASAAVSEQFAKYNLDSSELVELDGVTSLKVVSSATKHVRVQTAPGVRTMWGLQPGKFEEYDFELALVSFIVPGKKTYMMNYILEAGELPRLEPAVNGMVDSFRLLERPSRYEAYGGFLGSVPGDALLGALVGLTVLALKRLGVI